MLKLTTDKHEASHSLSATAEFLASYNLCIPRSRGPRRNIAIPFGMEKLEWWGYPTVKKL